MLYLRDFLIKNNKLKILNKPTLVVFRVFLFFFILFFAQNFVFASNEILFTSDTDLTVGSEILTISNGSTVDQITITDTGLEITLSMLLELKFCEWTYWQCGWRQSL